MEKTVKVTLIKSLIAAKPNMIKTAESLGLKKIGDSFEGKDLPSLRGKIRIIAHLVSVEEEA